MSTHPLVSPPKLLTFNKNIKKEKDLLPYLFQIHFSKSNISSTKQLEAGCNPHHVVCSGLGYTASPSISVGLSHTLTGTGNFHHLRSALGDRAVRGWSLCEHWHLDVWVCINDVQQIYLLGGQMGYPQHIKF